MRIFLTGMPGSGKSTSGKMLADKLDYPFVDLDNVIEAREGTTISSIFEQKGEDYFRKLESESLKLTIEANQKLVLSTGGGTPCFLDNLELMKNYGKVIFLDIPLKVLAERLQKEIHRPLLQTDKELNERLEELYNQRIGVYRQADYIVNSYEDLELLVNNWKIQRA